MAKAPTRAAVTARGIDLLLLIAAASDGYLMLTQDEGVDAVNAGDAIVDSSIVKGDLAAVRLTDAGMAKVKVAEANGASAPAPAAASSNGAFAIDDDVAMPTISRKARENVYPFDSLQVGQSFHVAPTEENPNPAERLASSVSAARARYAINDPSGKTEEVTVRKYKKDEAGEFVKVGGKRVLESETKETRPVKLTTRDFKVVPVGADDKRGVGARVFRTA
jgi:hypothetical protein